LCALGHSRVSKTWRARFDTLTARCMKVHEKDNVSCIDSSAVVVGGAPRVKDCDELATTQRPVVGSGSRGGHPNPFGR